MIDIFLKSPLPNSLAVLVLIALVITLVTAILLNVRIEPVSTETGWYPKLLPGFTLLALPALWDLLHITGIALPFIIIILAAILANIIVPLFRMFSTISHPLVRDWYRWSVPASIVGGLALTVYLTFIRTPGAACGLSSGCDDVIDGRFGTLFGFLPVGTLGLFGYVGILLGWLAWQFGPAFIRKPALIFTWAQCLFGVLFSIYLTFLEPFVIGATCMWCICSAVLMMGLLHAVIPPAHDAFAPEYEDDEEEENEPLQD
jgi:uncharacterized membrane protein